MSTELLPTGEVLFMPDVLKHPLTESVRGRRTSPRLALACSSGLLVVATIIGCASPAVQTAIAKIPTETSTKAPTEVATATEAPTTESAPTSAPTPYRLEFPGIQSSNATQEPVKPSPTATKESIATKEPATATAVPPTESPTATATQAAKNEGEQKEASCSILPAEFCSQAEVIEWEYKGQVFKYIGLRLPPGVSIFSPDTSVLYKGTAGGD
ncbi:hypothetical protein KKE03_00795, partial [Patescibacteria group bacterium]|nr:hypothetical protein [Patescibacteria group bacterium]